MTTIITKISYLSKVCRLNVISFVNNNNLYTSIKRKQKHINLSEQIQNPIENSQKEPNF